MFSLKDNLSSAFSYKPFSGCVMASLRPSYDWRQYVMSLGVEHPIELELEPHVTIVYGIRSAEMLNVHEYLKSWLLIYADQLRDIRLEKVATRFENADKDVLKFDVIGDYSILQMLRDDIMRKFYCETEYKEYVPHVTISYVKKGSNRHRKIMLPQDSTHSISGLILSWNGFDKKVKSQEILAFAKSSFFVDKSLLT